MRSCAQGLTYFRPWGFSINEGCFPNIHLSWNLCGMRRIHFYVALSRRLKWFFSFPWSVR
jgi:hypothetical protein